MRHITLLLFTPLLFTTAVQAQNESEPNNTLASANAMTLGTGMSGSWCSGEAVDLFTFTTPADGYLQVAFDAAHTDSQINVFLQVRLLDADGNDVAGSTTTSGPDGAVQANPFTLFCIAQGTYYFQVSGDDDDECNGYMLTATLVQPPFGNDNEPDNSSAQAQQLTAGTYAEGHLNYSYAGDNSDWFRFDVPGDGSINLDLDAFNQNAGFSACTMVLLDAAMDTVNTFNAFVGAVFVPDTAFNAWTQFCLSQGTYYLHIADAQICGMSYRVRWNFFAPPFANDAEPNNSSTQAQALPLGTWADGHLNYSFGGDDSDWFRFETPGDGYVSMQLDAYNQNGGTFGSNMELYNSTLTSVSDLDLIVGAIFGPDTAPNAYTQFCLSQGTYYVHLSGTQLCGMSYRIRADFTAALLAADAEPNNAMAEAIPVVNGEQHEGHLGFDPGNDTADWYSFPMPTAGNPTLTMESTIQNSGFYGQPLSIYDHLGTVVGTVTNSFNGGSTFSMNNLSLGTLDPGTYYLEVTSPACGLSYRFTLNDIGTVGIQEEAAAMQATASPNPSADGLFTIRTSGFTPVLSELLDASGRLMQRNVVASGNGPIILDASTYAPGVYVARLTDATGRKLQVQLVRAQGGY